MQIRELAVPDAFEFTPAQLTDDRGLFCEWYRHDLLAETIGHPLDLRQANLSVSRRGVVRGVHYADVPRGQAKFVTAVRGAVIDYVVDIRVGSPAFGAWDAVRLDDVDRRAVYVAEGLGHCFVAVTDDATVSYLVSDVYRQGSEHAVNPLDPEIGLEIPIPADELILSQKDLEAPGLHAARDAGGLPEWDAMRAYYASLADSGSR